MTDDSFRWPNHPTKEQFRWPNHPTTEQSSPEQSYDAWPELIITRPSSGAILKTHNNRIIGHISLDGRHHFLNADADNVITSWEAFGVTDPVIVRQLENDVEALITQLAMRHGTS